MKKWTAEFKRGRESVEDDGWSGRQKYATADENVNAIHTLVMCDRMRDLLNIASEVDISFGAVQSINTIILGMSKVSASWVAQILTMIRKGFGLTFVSISCLAMKMIPAILLSEL